MSAKLKKKLAPGRVRCLCCRLSMARLKSRQRQVHYHCLGLHIGGRCEVHPSKRIREMREAGRHV